MELNYDNYIEILTNAKEGLDKLNSDFDVYDSLKNYIEFKVKDFNESNIHFESKDDLMNTLKFVKKTLSTLRECTNSHIDKMLGKVEYQIEDCIKGEELNGTYAR